MYTEKLDIMRAIKDHGFLSKTVAEKLEISAVSMSNRINSDNPCLKTLQRIANVIGCNVSDMFYFFDENGEEVKMVKQPTYNGSITSQSQIESNLEGVEANHTSEAQLTSEPSPMRTMFCPKCGTKFLVEDVH